MYDLYAPYGGDISWGASGDGLLATGLTLAEQRVATVLLTNSQILDLAGNVVQLADDKFNPAYGAGLGADVGSIDSVSRGQVREARALTALSQEPSIDQGRPISLGYQTVDDKILFVVQFTDREGNPGGVGVAVTQ